MKSTRVWGSFSCSNKRETRRRREAEKARRCKAKNLERFQVTDWWRFVADWIYFTAFFSVGQLRLQRDIYISSILFRVLWCVETAVAWGDGGYCYRWLVHWFEFNYHVIRLLCVISHTHNVSINLKREESLFGIIIYAVSRCYIHIGNVWSILQFSNRPKIRSWKPTPLIHLMALYPFHTTRNRKL